MERKKTKNIKSAFLMTAFSKYSNILINLFFTVILARLLTAEDYGIVAIANVFLNFFTVFSDMGISAAIIQNKDLTDEDNNAIYSFSVYLGILLMILFILFSFPLSFFYRNKVYVSVGILLSFSLFFTTLNMVPNALLLKDKLFSIAAKRSIIRGILVGLVTVIFAILDCKYYSIVLANIIGSAFIFVWNKFFLDIKFYVRFSKQSIKKIWGFSIFQFAFNFVNYFSRNLDSILTGKYMGAIELGYYNKAYSLTQYPISALSNVVSPALHPFLSEHQDEKKYIYEKYLDIVRIFMIIGVFCSIFFYFTADEVISIMYGNGWEDSVPCLMWLGISIWAQLAISCISAIFQSLGDTKNLFLMGFVNMFLNILFVVIGILRRSIISLSVAMGIAYCIQFFVSNFILIVKTFKYSYINFLVRFYKEGIIALVLIVVGVLFKCEADNYFANFLIKLLLLGGVYVILLWIFGELRRICEILGIQKKTSNKADNTL